MSSSENNQNFDDNNNTQDDWEIYVYNLNLIDSIIIVINNLWLA